MMSEKRCPGCGRSVRQFHEWQWVKDYPGMVEWWCGRPPLVQRFIGDGQGMMNGD